MSKVFVIQQTDKNLAPARDHGEITILLEGSEPPEIAKGVLIQKMTQHMGEDDFLLLIGHPLNIAIASYIAMSIFPRVKFLVWSREHFRYDVVEVTGNI